MDDLTTVVKTGLTAGRIHFSMSVGIGSPSQLLLGDWSTSLHTSSSLKGKNSLSVGSVNAGVGLCNHCLVDFAVEGLFSWQSC